MKTPKVFYDLTYNYGASPEDDFNIGEACPNSLTANINLGLLLDLFRLAKMKYIKLHNLDENQLVGKEWNKFFNYYLRVRNRLILDFLDTAGHECRHLFQYGYAESKLHKNDKAIQIYKNLFDGNADAVVHNIYGDHHLEMPIVNLTSFLLDKGVVECDENMSLTQFTHQELLHIVYLKQKYEKDARDYSLGKLFEFKCDVADQLLLEKENVANKAYLFGSLKSSKPYRLADLKLVNKRVSKYYSSSVERELYIDKESQFIDMWVKNVQENVQQHELVGYLLYKALNGKRREAIDELERIVKYDLLKNLFDSEEKLESIKSMLLNENLDDAVDVIDKWHWEDEQFNASQDMV